MSNKNITLHELDNSNNYNALYPTTLATQANLSDATKALFDNSISDVDSAMLNIAKKIKTLNNTSVQVLNSADKPMKKMSVLGLSTTQKTNDDGIVAGERKSSSLTVVSPYVDIPSKSIDATELDEELVVVKMDTVEDGKIVRVTNSEYVIFSNLVKTIDVCCVCGGIAFNAYGISVLADEKYKVIIGEPKVGYTSAFGASSKNGATSVSEFDDGTTYYTEEDSLVAIRFHF